MRESDVTEADTVGAAEPGSRPFHLSRWTIMVAIVSILVLAASLIPSPYAVEGPGPTLDVLGTTLDENGDELPVIRIDGVENHDDDGILRLLTVSISGSPQHPRSWFSLIPAALNPKQDIRPLEEFFPEGITEDERTQQNSVRMTSSQDVAAAAAFTALGEDVPVTLSVAQIMENGPATGVLQEGDVIIAVAGNEVAGFGDLRDAIAANGAGVPLTLTVERDGQPVDVTVVPAVPENGTEPAIGAVIQSEFELPYEVEFAVDDIGGPSAGLIFSLGIMDLMTPKSLLNGLHVAGTGTISIDGVVGPIGGLEEKMLGASSAGSELFLMPMANCKDLPERTPAGMQIATVATLDEAVSAIKVATEGGTPPGIERCSVS